MKRVWTHRTIEAPAARVWDILVDVDAWPEWGPSVRAASIDAPELAAGVRGTVVTAVGAELSFEIDRFDPGRRWSWHVASLPATDHTVDELGTDRCRVGFGVPWAAAPYLAICRVALHRIDRMATTKAAS